MEFLLFVWLRNSGGISTVSCGRGYSVHEWINLWIFKFNWLYWIFIVTDQISRQLSREILYCKSHINNACKGLGLYWTERNCSTWRQSCQKNRTVVCWSEQTTVYCHIETESLNWTKVVCNSHLYSLFSSCSLPFWLESLNIKPLATPCHMLRLSIKYTSRMCWPLWFSVW